MPHIGKWIGLRLKCKIISQINGTIINSDDPINQSESDQLNVASERGTNSRQNREKSREEKWATRGKEVMSRADQNAKNIARRWMIQRKKLPKSMFSIYIPKKNSQEPNIEQQIVAN